MSSSAIGRSVLRVDGLEKVTGRATYTGDIKLVGMVHAAIVRSPFPRARMRSIDADALRTRPEVHAVLTAADVPDGLYGHYIEDQPILARGEARYEGEPVAVVVAGTPEDATFAAEALEIDWEPLDALTNVDAALAPGAAPIHPERPGETPAWLAAQGLSGINCCHTFVREQGDVDTAFATAEHIFDDTFEVPPIQAFALERFECVALWSGSELTVWSSTQSPFLVRRDLARLFGLPLARVHVVAPLVGGGFGAKLYTKIEPITVACALALPDRPVKLSLSANESAQTITRHPARVRIRTGVSADGRIVARECFTVLDTGAYADAGKRVADKAGYRAPGPYRIENVRSRSCAVYTNIPPAGAYRGFGAPQVVWAYESQMDLIAERVGIDPVEFRRRNLLERGEYFSPDDTPLDCDVHAALDRVVDRMQELPLEPVDTATPGSWRVGEGYAIGVKDGGGQRTASSAEVRLDEDGSATVLVGSTEIGQGTLTVLAQLVAEELQIDVDRVHVALPDTRRAPYDSGTNASRTVTLVGSAVVAAARDVREQLIETFREVYDLDSSTEITLHDTLLSGGGRAATVAEAMQTGAVLRGGCLIGIGYFRTEQSENVLGAPTAFWEPGVAGVQIAVDVETGALRLLAYVSAIDAGKAINPRLCEGQDLGGAMMAMGHALSEQLTFDGGQLLNASLVDYRLPSFSELPEIFDSILIENGDGPGPHGARGVGEGGSLPTAPAIANAVAAATGARVRSLPLTPEAVWRALQQADASKTEPVPELVSTEEGA
jgi:CO/xanthine dehydrogenase Mo-binding subunit